MKIGNTYFFKDGNIRSIDLNITEEELDEACLELTSSYLMPVVSTEEHKFNPDVKRTVNSSLDVYKEFIDKGYSIIRTTADYNIGPERANKATTNRCDLIVAEKITEKDAINIESVYDKVEPKNSFDLGHLYNMNRNMFGEVDYDFYNPARNRMTLSSKILPLFLKEKLGTLNEEEKKIVDSYRNFDLEYLLLEDIPSDYKLNNDNTGVLIIGKSNMYASTNKKGLHELEINSILNHINPEVDESLDIYVKADKSKSIIIQISKGSLIIWSPSVLTEYQINQLSDISNLLKQINKTAKENDKEEVNIALATVNGDDINTVVEPDYGASIIDGANLIKQLDEFIELQRSEKIESVNKVF